MLEAKYVVHRSGIVDAKSSDAADIYDASVLGYVIVPDGPDARYMAKEKALQALGLQRVYLTYWTNADETEKQFAEERGNVAPD